MRQHFCHALTYNPGQNNLEHFQFWGMHSTVPSPPCSGVQKRSLGNLNDFELCEWEAGEID